MPAAPPPGRAAVDRETLESLTESLPDPVVAIDRAKRVAWLNPAAEEWLQRSGRRVVGRAFDDPEAPAAGRSPAFAKAVDDALSGPRTVTLTLDDERRSSVCIAPWWRAGEVVGVVVVVRPAGDAGGADMATLAAGLAHEIRNPLASLRGATELLQGELGATASTPAGEYLRLILNETGRVDALVRRMLDLSKPPELHRGPVSPSPLVHDLALQAAAFAGALGRRVEIVERFDPALPPLFADRDALFAALVNLVKNAVEASPDGGRIVLEAGLDGERRQRIEGGRLARVLRFSVLDDGPGFTGAESRLFTPFFTTKGTGTGLGLLLARRTIEAHDGRLLLSTRRARDDASPPGAEATVLLPMEATDG